VPANSTSDGQFDPARFSTAGIREIKVSYGSSSVLYGDNALAAVIEIATVDSRRDEVVEVNVGAPELAGVNGRYARTVGNWSLMATGTSFTSDGFRLPGSFTPTSIENGGLRLNSDRDRHELRGGLGYRVSPAFSLVGGRSTPAVTACRRAPSTTAATSRAGAAFRTRHRLSMVRPGVREPQRRPPGSTSAPGSTAMRSRIGRAMTTAATRTWTTHWCLAPSSRASDQRHWRLLPAPT
jgi:outer membrane receptor protein involved in Fe transport